MSLNQIVVQLNPDCMPSGSDLCVVNAARRSFGKRSELEYVSIETGDGGTVKRVGLLKDSDKNLIHFLARGMTSNDWACLCCRFYPGRWSMKEGNIVIIKKTEPNWAAWVSPDMDYRIQNIGVITEVRDEYSDTLGNGIEFTGVVKIKLFADITYRSALWFPQHCVEVIDG